MISPDNEVFHRKLAERKAANEAKLREQQKQKQAELQFDSDLVPEDQFDITDADKQMDKVINNIDILDAYTRWCGKMKPKVKGNQRESIMISCPVPTHPDKVPSAWINLDKQTWFCGGCQLGGDSHDIAAYHFGFPVPAYKTGASFHELRREMAKDFGFTFTMLPGGAVQVEAPESTPKPILKTGSVVAPEPKVESEPEPEAEVIELYEDEDENILLPTLDWRSIVPEETFLDSYMRATSIDDIPEEYHFWNGLLALGFALGRDVHLFDSVPIYGNLFICTLGNSGSGKSKARYHLDNLLLAALPHVWTDEHSKGVRKVSTPGSAEVLIHNFQKPVSDPANAKIILYYAPVRGLIDFSELSSLVGRTARMGNVLVPTLMQFYDMEGLISTSSMSTGSKEAHQPFASALTTTQPRALKDLLNKTDIASGFLNRWVFVSGKEKRRIAIGGVKIDMTPAIKPLQEIIAYAASYKSDEEMTWSAEAAKAFTIFFHEVIQRDKRRDSSELLVRADLLVKKLILLFTANLKLKEVPLVAVEKAIECYPYIIGSYSIPAEQIGNTLNSEIQQAVMRQARKQFERDKRGVTLFQVSKALIRHKYPNEILLKTFDGLVKLGWLTIEKSIGAGRPTVRYKISS